MTDNSDLVDDDDVPDPGGEVFLTFSHKDVLALIRKNPGQMGKRELANALSLTGDERIALKRILRDLETDGAIAKSGRRAYRAMDDLPAVTLIEIVGQDGDGDLTARPVAQSAELDLDAPEIEILVPAHKAAGRDRPRRPRAGRRGAATSGESQALGVGERALARLTKLDDGTYRAKIIKRLGKDGRRVLGVVYRSDAGLRIAPTNKSVRSDLALRPGDHAKVAEGDVVLVTIDRDRHRGLKIANLVEVIGQADSPGAASVIAIHEHGLVDGFGAGELAEAEAATPAGVEGREDLTKIPLITIEPDDARDHDDAVWAAPDDDKGNAGGHVVIVAIADVAAYVTPDSALDRGALERGNSAYFPDRVVPMLPERLSTDLCSLVEGRQRPCLAVRMVFDAQGQKRRHTFVRATMRSAAKLSYTQAQAAIDGRADDKTEPLLAPVLRPLWAAYAVLSKARTARDPLDLDLPERRVRIGADGKVSDISVRERFDAHRLIEELMIQANVCAAETLEKKKTPLVYRVHEPPAREKLHALADFLPEVKLTWNKGEPPTTTRFNHLMAKARDTEHAQVVGEMVLRTQSQAVYHPENQGHFGLNLARYAHFTSPIRRYADLLVHRALIRSLSLGPAPDQDGLTDGEIARLEGVAQRISTTERRAMAAERDAMDRYLAAYLADKEGAVFAARIAGLNRAGLFVRLTETGADGLAPISTLGLERFRHDVKAQALVGEDTGGRYRLGMAVEVRLVEATPVTGGLIFELETPPEQGNRPKRRDGKPGRGTTKGRKTVSRRGRR